MSLHPGVVNTEFSRFLDTDYPKIAAIKSFLNIFSSYFTKSPLQGAQTTLHCALAPESSLVNGAYYRDCMAVAPTEDATNKKWIDLSWVQSQKYVSKFTGYESFGL